MILRNARQSLYDLIGVETPFLCSNVQINIDFFVHHAPASRDSGINSEHTQFRHVGFVDTSRRCRNCTPESPFRISSSGRSLIFPIDGWKKQGLTVPSASTTVDTQGALQRGETASASPRCARK